MNKPQNWEHLEAATEEVRPLLWYVSDITGRTDVEQFIVSERSTVGNLLSNDVDGSVLRRLSEKLEIPVAYSDTLIHVIRRFVANCLAKRV